MRKLILSLVPAVLLLVVVVDAWGDPVPVPDPNAGAFQALSPGNQKIAQSLYDAQAQPAPGLPPSPTAPKVYSLDEIAELKQGGQGWGGVFRTMQGGGQLEGAKNLGQIVSGKYQPPAVVTPPAPPGVTTPTGTTPTGPTGAFTRLSPGNQKIARALYDGQQQPPAGSPPSPTAPKVYSLDEIAGMKQSGQGWGGVFREMKGHGQLEGAKNLGSLVSGRYASPTVTTITTASGRTEVVSTRSGSSHGPTIHKHGGSGSGTGSSGPDATKGGAHHRSGPSTTAGSSGSHGGGHGHTTHAKASPGGHGKGHTK